MRQGLFEVFGDGSLGLKADYLNQFSQKLVSVGLSIPEGMVIATGIFDLLAQQIDFENAAQNIDIGLSQRWHLWED